MDPFPPLPPSEGIATRIQVLAESIPIQGHSASVRGAVEGVSVGEFIGKTLGLLAAGVEEAVVGGAMV